MRNTSAGDHRFDAPVSDQPAVFVVVVAPVGEQDVGATARPAGQTGDGGNLRRQGQELDDAITVPASQGHGERDAPSVDEAVVLAARPCSVDRAGAAFGPGRAARTWRESLTARDRSSCLADRSFFSRTT